MVLAGIKGALRVSGESLASQVFAISGAGAGGIGVARQIHAGLLAQGLSSDDARERVFVTDSRGVIFDGRDGVDEYKREFSKSADFAAGWDLEDPGKITLLDLSKNAGVSVLIGLSGAGGTFSEELIRTIAGNAERPVVFPLSNPTDKTEAIPEDIYKWTDGRAIVAAGSPFPDVNHDGKVFIVGQGNNVFIFPGVGLGALLVRAEVITDEMITAAARKLSELVSAERLELSCVYPPIGDLRILSREIAIEVARTAMEQEVARKPADPARLDEIADSKMWAPRYGKFVKSSA